jgi:hypothetical protein
MTLTPSVRAISLCSFPCVARSFACASFDAISTLECLFFLGIAASLRAPDAANFIAHYYKGTRCFPCRFRNAEQAEQIAPKGETDRLGIAKKMIGDCQKSPDDLQPLPRRRINHALCGG